MKFFKILFVDDDELVLKDLLHMINWEKLGFTIAGTAINGKAALRMCRDCRPDVVITDIRMPQMDGLEFIREIRRQNPDIYLLILSSYGEFEYAKAAIDEGVQEYLLKMEITPKSLSSKMQNIYIRLSSSKRSNDKAVRMEIKEYFGCRIPGQPFTWIFQNSPEERRLVFFIFSNPVLLTASLLGNTPEQENANMAEKLESLPCLRGMDVSVLFPFDGYVILGLPSEDLGLYQPAPFARKLRSSLMDILQKTIYIFYTDSPITMKRFRSDLHGSENVLNWKSVTSFKSSAECFSEACSTRFSKAVEIKDFPHLLSLSSDDDVFAYFSEYSRLLFNCCDYEGLSGTLKYLTANICADAPSLEQITEAVKSPEAMSVFLKTTFNEWKDTRGVVNVVQCSSSVRAAIEYIDSHYMDPDLNLQCLADHVALSVGRLSVLFKKELCKTPNDWITDCRIEHAIDFLMHSNYKIYEISEKVGYRSSQYFSRIFQQRTGKKPLDYRKKSSITYSLGGDTDATGKSIK